jgi:Signal transduction histidine kinase
MKKIFPVRSIYAKFVLIFVGIWWLLNSLTFAAVFHFISNGLAPNFKTEWITSNSQVVEQFHRIRSLTGIAFLTSALFGTFLIIIVVRSIVKPIKQLSKASKEVAKGNFDIEIQSNLRDEIGQLTADFNIMTKELRNIDILRKDFVSNVSHEFRTPITSVIGYAKLIKSGSLTDTQLKEYSEIIINEGERLSLLSSNLLKLSELDSKVIWNQSSSYSLDEQVRKSILLLEIQWTKKDLSFDIDLEEVVLFADKNLLQQVWLNLIQNAIKFSEPGGLIKICLNRRENRAIFKITNQGSRIEEEDREHIFERFYKGDKSRSRDGFGLGLVLVKKIVELSNGVICFNSTKEEGTTFVVELPIN